MKGVKRSQLWTSDDLRVGGSMAGFGVLFLTSFKAIVTLLIQYALGVLLGYRHIIRPSDMRAFSTAMNMLLIPLLSFTSLGRGLTLERFVADGWVLALFGFISLYEFAIIGLALRWVAAPPPVFRRLFVMLVAFPNVVAIPLSITQTLCELGTFDDEYASREQCVLQSRASVFMCAARSARYARARRSHPAVSTPLATRRELCAACGAGTSPSARSTSGSCCSTISRPIRANCRWETA